MKIFPLSKYKVEFVFNILPMKKPFVFLENIEILDYAAEGKCIAKHEGKVVFVPFAVPGDIVDLKVLKSKKSYMDAVIERIVQPSPFRIVPQCEHFGLCGGCKWQHIPYSEQLKMKKSVVTDAIQRIGRITDVPVNDVLGSENTFFYRNKLEFSFTDSRWLEICDMDMKENIDRRALGYHVPGRFDKIFHVNACYLQDPFVDEIRKVCYQAALELNIPFYNQRENTGNLRNIIIRSNSKKEFLLIVVAAEPSTKSFANYLSSIQKRLPELTGICYVENTKRNDSYDDLKAIPYSGQEFLTENLGGLHFEIAPLSFFQVNVKQAERLYASAIDMAKIANGDLVYDLYCGTGTISLYAAQFAKKVIGIEYVTVAVENAQSNAQRNEISNVEFFAGDMAKILTTEFFMAHGSPDVIITDPPRSGMHPEVVKSILDSGAQKVVYVSCNPATQARDIELLSEKYKVEKIQPVDMFPQTHHVENIVLLHHL